MDSAAERTMSGEPNDPTEAAATTGTTRSNARKMLLEATQNNK
jgi:hypothetical protein